MGVSDSRGVESGTSFDEEIGVYIPNDVEEYVSDLNEQEKENAVLVMRKLQNYTHLFATKQELIKYCRKLTVISELKDFYFKQFDSKRMTIKLVIIEAPGNKRWREIITGMRITPKFGFCHVGLIVNNRIVEFCDNSICVPRRTESSRAVFSHTIYQSVNHTVNEQMFDKICEIIVKWNAYSWYNVLFKNCQHFVDDLLDELKLELKLEGALGLYVERLRKTGKCDAWFPVTKETATRLGIAEGEIVFMSHKDLDMFVTEKIHSADASTYYLSNPDGMMDVS
jgi:hypothetical protein